MSAIANIVLPDSSAANHTFAPVNINADGVAKWADRATGIPSQFPTITFQVKEPQGSARNYRLQARVTCPVVRSINGVETVISRAVGTFDVSLPPEMVEAERVTLRKFLEALLGNGHVGAAFSNLEAVY